MIIEWVSINHFRDSTEEIAFPNPPFFIKLNTDEVFCVGDIDKEFNVKISHSDKLDLDVIKAIGIFTKTIDDIIYEASSEWLKLEVVKKCQYYNFCNEVFLEKGAYGFDHSCKCFKQILECHKDRSNVKD